MRFYLSSLYVLCLLVMSSWSYAQSDERYQLSADDTISITVFNEPDLSIEALKISADGSVSLPLIGEVTAEGLTLVELEESVKAKYRDGYLKKPDVSIAIVEYRPFYIKGFVKTPGGYPFRKGLTVEKAIALAGGFAERASKNDITLLQEKTGKELLKVKPETRIQPGDIITVNESFF